MVNLTKIRAAILPQKRVAHPFPPHRKGWVASDTEADLSPVPLAPGPWPLTPRTSGFTLLELLVVMVIIATLAAMAIPAYTRNVLAAKEAVLKEDLRVLRGAIDSYTVDKQKAPTSLSDLVQSGYLKQVPKDPITGRTDTWTTTQSDTLSTVDQTDSGIDDVHSGSQQASTDGTTYNTW